MTPKNEDAISQRSAEFSNETTASSAATGTATAAAGAEAFAFTAAGAAETWAAAMVVG
jgi:hypothetical protein